MVLIFHLSLGLANIINTVPKALELGRGGNIHKPQSLCQLQNLGDDVIWVKDAIVMRPVTLEIKVTLHGAAIGFMQY